MHHTPDKPRIDGCWVLRSIDMIAFNCLNCVCSSGPAIPPQAQKELDSHALGACMGAWGAWEEHVHGYIEGLQVCAWGAWEQCIG